MAVNQHMSKKEKIDQNSSITSIKIDADQVSRFDEVQQELDRVNEESGRAILNIEQKYVKLRQPLFQKRAEYIAKIPNFWLVTFSNHPQTSELICDEDEKALAYLKKVEVEDFEDVKSGYKLHFYFNENPYFTNKLLTREFTISEDGSSTTTATLVDYLPGKCLASKPDKKDGKQTFFSWLTTSDKNNFDEIGEAIKEEIWTNPLHFFLMEEDGMEEDEDEEDEESDGEEDDIDEEEEDEEEES